MLCFPAPYGVIGDPVELFNCTPSNKESPSIDELVQLEMKETMMRISKHVSEGSKHGLRRLVCEFIMDRFGKIYLQTVSHYEWAPPSKGPEGAATPEMPQQPNNRLQMSVRSPRQPRAPRGTRPSTARYRPRQVDPTVVSSFPARPQSARAGRAMVERLCRDADMVDLSKGLQTTSKQIQALQTDLRQRQEEAEEIREEMRRNKQIAEVERRNLKTEWAAAIDSRQGGAKGSVDDRISSLKDLVKKQQQEFGTSMSRSMLMFRDELVRVHQEFDRRDHDNLERIRGLEQKVASLHAELRMAQHSQVAAQRSSKTG